ncbi:MAG: hypothetical protein Q8M29_17370 [Bacteroidota bacterium]|nr:hypothetical protein [Bacteroidota bacterium]
MKEILFNPYGPPLWINIEMAGVYLITYSYQLWSAKNGEPAVLTNPLKQGNNIIPHDDHYPVLNDHNPTDILTNYPGRIIDVRFNVKKVEGNDNGYVLKVNILQGLAFETASLLDTDKVEGTVGEAGFKPESILIKLKSVA